MKVEITRTKEEFADLPLPQYQTAGSAGMDVYAAVSVDVVLCAGGVAIIPTSLAISLPIGYECQVRSRSGLAAKNGVFALNAPGTIDSDYRGEIGVILANFGKEDFVVRRGDRIAQLVIARYEYVDWDEVDELDATARGAGGFGSTGK
ncbi:MAG: dUTP diphosphatase [Ignavibacteria bacterium]|jgi:dUTP pyrophosphatase|nr:dUTP diphosphatase [Ignavibacteria bacterium]